MATAALALDASPNKRTAQHSPLFGKYADVAGGLINRVARSLRSTVTADGVA
jgi:hypothetical protein